MAVGSAPGRVRALVQCREGNRVLLLQLHVHIRVAKAPARAGVPLRPLGGLVDVGGDCGWGGDRGGGTEVVVMVVMVVSGWWRRRW